jgi:hypothetical protein
MFFTSINNIDLTKKYFRIKLFFSFDYKLKNLANLLLEVLQRVYLEIFPLFFRLIFLHNLLINKHKNLHKFFVLQQI